MKPLRRQYELKKKGITQKALAEELGVAEMSVSNVLRGKMVSRRIMKAISEKLGKDIRVVFPKPIRQRRSNR